MFHVEHTHLGFFCLKIVKLTILGAVCVSVQACEKRLENPESVDPVYHALQKEHKDAEAAVAAMEKQLEESKKSYEATKPMEKMKIQLRREIYQQEAALKKLREKELYQRLLVAKRVDEARLEYDRAYRNKETWPNPESFKSYEATERLKKAPRNWSSRVPKRTDTPKPAPKAEASAPPAH